MSAEKEEKAIKKLNFTKIWTNKNDFPTYEENEEQVRKDMQCLHDETRAAFNALVEELMGDGAAALIGAAAPAGLAGGTVQAVLDELAGAIGELGGSFEVEGSALVELVAAAVERRLMAEYYTAPQVEEKLTELGVAALEERVDTMENALSADGVVVGEVPAVYPFTLPAAELAGAVELMGESRPVWLNGELVALAATGEAARLVRVQPEEGSIMQLALSGDSIPMADAEDFEAAWADDGYLIGKADGTWYLVSVNTGVCSLLTAAVGSVFCGAARIGNIVTAVFHKDGALNFMRRSIAGDSGSEPAITALDPYTESGSAYDRLLNVCGGLFVMLKYDASGSALKVYDPAELTVGTTVAVGTAARARSIRAEGEDCFFIFESEGASRPARCSLSDGVPAITVGEFDAESVIGVGGDVFVSDGAKVLRLERATLAALASIELPAAAVELIYGGTSCALWGGKYVLAGPWLLNVENGKLTALRCDGEAPEEFALMPAAERCFAARAKGRWYVFDSLLRPLWGMVPYAAGGLV